MMMLMAILFFFTICCEYAILMEIGTAGSSTGQISAGSDYNEDFKDCPDLVKIFEFYDLLAVRGHKLFAHPSIMDDPVKALKSAGIIDELNLDERMIKLAGNVQEFLTIQGENGPGTEKKLTPEQRKRFAKINFLNTKQLLFEPLLLDAINKVDRQNEIQNDLKEIWAKENEDELRLRQKYLFKYGFIVDCIFAYYMDENQKIDFDKIRKITITPVENIEKHPFYTILTENKCASKEEIRIFVNVINPSQATLECIRIFFVFHVIKEFVKEMIEIEKKENGKLEEEYAQLRRNPYFLENYPKIFNLLALLDLLPQIVKEIIGEIKPKDTKSDEMDLMSQILLGIKKVNILGGEKIYIASHFKTAVSQIPSEKLRAKLEAISEKDSIFPAIISHYIKYQYKEWFDRLKFHMLKFLAEKYFYVPDIKKEDNNWEKISVKISKNIVQKTFSIIIEEENNRLEEEKKKNELLSELHLRIFCVGIRQMDSTKRILSKSDNIEECAFHTIMGSKLLGSVPGTIEKFKEIIIPKEELCKRMSHKNKQRKMNLFFEAVSEVRNKICKEKQRQKEKQERLKKTILSFIDSESHFGD